MTFCINQVKINIERNADPGVWRHSFVTVPSRPGDTGLVSMFLVIPDHQEWLERLAAEFTVKLYSRKTSTDT